MYLTPRVFAQHLVENFSTQYVVDMLGSMQMAVNKFGSRFMLRVATENDKDNDLHAFARFLQKHGQLSVKKIKTLLALVKSLKNDYQKDFMLTGIQPDTIEWVLKDRFGDVAIEERQKDNVVEIRGAWWIYKRSLDGDLKKLLHENN